MQWGLVLLMMGSMWGEVTGVRYCKDGKAATKVRPCPEDQGWKAETTDPRSFLGWIILGWVLGFFLLTATVTLLCLLWVLLRYCEPVCIEPGTHFSHDRRPDKEDLAIIALWLHGRFTRGGAGNIVPPGEGAENAPPNREAGDNPTAEVADHDGEPVLGPEDDQSHSGSTTTTASPPRTSGAFGINGMGDGALVDDNSGYEADADPNTSPVVPQPLTAAGTPGNVHGSIRAGVDPVATATVPEVEEGHAEYDKNAIGSPQVAPRYVPLLNLYLSSVTFFS